MASAHRRFDNRNWLERARARLVAMVAIALVAVSGGLLSEMSRQSQAETPNVLLAHG